MKADVKDQLRRLGFKTADKIKAPIKTDLAPAKVKGKVTVGTVLTNFVKVFPRSIPDKVFQHQEHSSLGSPWVTFKAEVRSSRPGVNYIVKMRYLRPTADGDITLNTPCEAWCTCPAFDFFVAYALYINKSFLGRPTRMNKIQAKVKNPKSIPTVCKHLYGFNMRMIDNRVILRRV